MEIVRFDRICNANESLCSEKLATKISMLTYSINLYERICKTIRFKILHHLFYFRKDQNILNKMIVCALLLIIPVRVAGNVYG